MMNPSGIITAMGEFAYGLTLLSQLRLYEYNINTILLYLHEFYPASFKLNYKKIQTILY